MIDLSSQSDPRGQRCVVGTSDTLTPDECHGLSREWNAECGRDEYVYYERSDPRDEAMDRPTSRACLDCGIGAACYCASPRETTIALDDPRLAGWLETWEAIL